MILYYGRNFCPAIWRALHQLIIISSSTTGWPCTHKWRHSIVTCNVLILESSAVSCYGLDNGAMLSPSDGGETLSLLACWRGRQLLLSGCCHNRMASARTSRGRRRRHHGSGPRRCTALGSPEPRVRHGEDQVQLRGSALLRHIGQNKARIRQG
jgi:hypothetical protein